MATCRIKNTINLQNLAIDVATGKYGCMIDKLADAMKSGNHDLFVRKRRQSLSTSTPDILSMSTERHFRVKSSCPLFAQLMGDGKRTIAS